MLSFPATASLLKWTGFNNCRYTAVDRLQYLSNNRTHPVTELMPSFVIYFADSKSEYSGSNPPSRDWSLDSPHELGAGPVKGRFDFATLVHKR